MSVRQPLGKSFTIEQAAREIAKREKKEFIKYDDDHANEILANPGKFFVFVDLRLTEVEPSDLSGIPRDRDDVDAVHFKPLLWTHCLSKAAGILLLDELTKDL